MNDIFENVWNILWYESFKNKIYLIMERIFDNMYLMNCSASSACTQRCAAAAQKKSSFTWRQQASQLCCHTKPVLYCWMQASGDYFTPLQNNNVSCLATCWIWIRALSSTSCCWSSFGNHEVVFVVKEMHCSIRVGPLSHACVRADARFNFVGFETLTWGPHSLTAGELAMVKTCRCRWELTAGQTMHTNHALHSCYCRI